MNFCITHNTDTDFPLGINRECVVVSCPPPPDMDLVFDYPEPSEDELILMDMAAEVLEADFVG